MSLTSRLSAFFLAALAVVLIGFALTLHLMAQTYLHRQTDERLLAALDTLSAAVDVKPDEVEWEGRQRQILLGQEDGADQVRWTVHTGQGQRVDRSRNLGSEDLIGAGLGRLPNQAESGEVITWKGQEWRLMQRRLEVKARPVAPPPAEGKGKPPKPKKTSKEKEKEDEDDDEPRPAAAGDRKPAALVLAAGISLQPVQATLRNLAWALGGLSLGVWLVAAFLGRWLARRALAPVSRMADAAQAMTARDLQERLPTSGTADELDNLARSFNDLLGRVQDAFERQRRFTGDASHQLRTPLAAMLGQVEVILRRLRTADEYREILVRVHGQANQLNHIVEMLLFLARADADARLPQLETLDLQQWLTGHVGRWSDHARSADLHLDCPANGPLLVQAQPPLLGQLVDNLVENACKYSDPGTPITVRLAGENGSVVLSVEDAGPGIPPEDLPHVFEPFFRSPQARQRERGGVGLGLTVAQRIAAAFGGKISVQSQVRQGARFSLELPKAGHG